MILRKYTLFSQKYPLFPRTSYFGHTIETIEISWQLLIHFSDSKIKISPEKFNSEEFQYPEIITNQTLRNNTSDIRFHLLCHYVESTFQNVDSLETDNRQAILRISRQLSKPNSTRNLKLKIIEEPEEGPSTPPRERKRRYENDDEQ